MTQLPDNLTWKTENLHRDIKGTFITSSANVIYAIFGPQCPSAFYRRQTGRYLCKRFNRHKSDVRNDNTQKPVSIHFNLPDTAQFLKTTILEKKNYKNPDTRQLR